MKLPPRSVLRLIVQDAISDRRGMRDPACATETAAAIASYLAFQPRLADGAPPLCDDDHNVLAQACMHARIWREGLFYSWANTGDKATILECRQDIARVTRTEDALGVVRHFMNGGPTPKGVRSVTLSELRAGSGAVRELEWVDV